MAFIQLIEFETSQPDEVKRIVEEFREVPEDKRTAKRVVLAKHRGQENRFCGIVFFDSYQEFAGRLNDLVEGEPTYVDLDVVEDLTL